MCQAESMPTPSIFSSVIQRYAKNRNLRKKCAKFLQNEQIRRRDFDNLKVLLDIRCKFSAKRKQNFVQGTFLTPLYKLYRILELFEVDTGYFYAIDYGPSGTTATS